MSNAWFDAIVKIRDEIGEIPGNQAIQDIVINLVVTDGPDGDQEMHMKAGSFERGLAENAPTKLTIPYEIARKLFAERDQQIAVEAFMEGQIRIEGDMGPLIKMQLPREDSPQSRKLKDRIKAITEIDTPIFHFERLRSQKHITSALEQLKETEVAELDELEGMLKNAIDDENYELAMELRDKINNLKILGEE